MKIKVVLFSLVAVAGLTTFFAFKGAGADDESRGPVILTWYTPLNISGNEYYIRDEKGECRHEKIQQPKNGVGLSQFEINSAEFSRVWNDIRSKGYSLKATHAEAGGMVYIFEK